ncbi:MAG TPA: hypothetical protein DD381_00850 [Lentisphaeria bacterium]|nr:MAG: hypothetical protein A2X47_00170 [Lentisphaerae bacterium GWF2_38_69]HBM14890.1 hypothetical protein [Lentisphaeria bacterium]
MTIKMRIRFLLQIYMLLIVSLVMTSCSTLSRGNKDSKDQPLIVILSDSDNIQKAINSLPEEGGTVFLKAKQYMLDKGLHINRSNIKLVGENGTRLKLKPNVNQPIILIGSGSEVPDKKINDIVVSDLELDGSKELQSSETDPERPWIRNNGIDIRNANRVWIEKVNIHDTRSGGLVASWNCKNLFINSSMFHNNEFDGIALYDSEDVLVRGFFCFDNKSAGVSLDNRLKHITFSSGSIKNNGDVGIFARDSADLKFDNIIIVGNKSHGCFFSNGTWEPEKTGIRRNFFSACSFLDNKGWGFWLASKADSSPDNTIVSSIFSGNTLGAIKVDEGGELELAGNAIKPSRNNLIKKENL